MHLLRWSPFDVQAGDVTHPDGLPQNLTRLQQLIENKESFEVGKRFIRPEASRAWVRNYVSLLAEATGDPQRIFCGSENIADPKRSVMDREKLIQALAAERARFEAVLRQMPAGVMIADSKTRSLELVNEQVREIIGHCYEIGQVIEEYDTQVEFQGIDIQQNPYFELSCSLARSLDRGENITNEEVRIQRADGQIVFINMNSVPIWDEQGQITAAVVVFQDITEQKQAEAALRKQEEELRLITDSVPALISYVDSDRRYRFVNRAYSDWFGHPPEEMIGKTVKEFIGAGLYQDLEEFVEAALSGKTVNLEHWIPFLRGVRFVRRQYVPDIDSMGKVRGFYELINDLTDLKKIEQTISRSEAWLRLALIVGQTGSWDWDIKTNSVVWSEGYFSILGLSPENCQPSYDLWVERIHPEDREATETAIQQAMVHHSNYQNEHRLLHTDGSYRWVQARGQFFYDEESLPQRMIGGLVDVTDHKQTQIALEQRAQELVRMNQLLRQATVNLERQNREQEQFTAIVSHDLKAPLRGIKSLASWIEDDSAHLLQEDSKQHLCLLKSRITRMQNLIDGLLHYSRIGHVEIPLEKVSVEEMLHELVDSLDPPEGFTVEIVQPMPTFYYTRQLLLRQVFSNLMSNAIRYCDRPDGKVTLSCEEQETQYCFTVADNGPGIAPKYHEKIFEIFQTLQSRDRTESTGIGLSIVKKVVELEGGTVTLKSKLGEGAIFQFTWTKGQCRD